MSIDSKLLWRAWPLGGLPKRGVRSVMGFTYLDDGLWHSTGGVAVDIPHSRRARGEMLPDLDDLATWAMAKTDLANVFPCPPLASNDWITGYTWTSNAGDEEVAGAAPDLLQWRLHAVTAYSGQRLLFSETIDPEHPTVAFVTARALVRENPDRYARSLHDKYANAEPHDVRGWKPK